MDLHSNHPYWLLKNGLLNSYPSLHENSNCDVAIIGAGVSGALLAWHFTQAGINSIIIDKRNVGTGSTCASTALLQYEIDVPLVDLVGKVGEKNAVNSYQLCLDSIGSIEKICTKIATDCGFQKRASLQYASYTTHVQKLEQEYEFRNKVNLPVHFLTADQMGFYYGFEKPAALLSDVAAELDAFAFTHHVLNHCIQGATKVYDSTAMTDISPNKKGFTITTSTGHTIQCKKVVIACGYESQQYLPQQVEKLYATYALVSEPFASNTFWHQNELIWETANPYLYMRTTNDNRILVGGKDVPYTNAKQRDALLKQKTKALETAFNKLMPQFNLKADYSWAGTFAGTKDGLPYIDEHPTKKGMYFSLGFGGNGITFSEIAGQILTDLVLGKKNKHASIFKFDR